MVTTEQKRNLLERIKNETKFYEIRLEGTGCEIAMGEITAEAYRYWHKKSDREFGNYMSQYRDMNMLGKVPNKAQFDRDWYEYDDIAHVSGILVKPTNKMYVDQFNKMFEYEDTIMSVPLDLRSLKRAGILVGRRFQWGGRKSHALAGKHYFRGVSREKGVWYSEEKIKQKIYNFDVKKLKLTYSRCENTYVFHELEYDGLEYLLATDTRGSSFDIGVRKGPAKEDFGKINQKNIWLDT